MGGYFTPRQLLFLLLVLTTTAFVDLLGDGKIDLASNAIVLASVYWFLRSLQKPNRLYFFFSGFFSGFAIIAKPFNVVLLGVFFLLLTISYLWLAEDKVVYFKSFMYASPGLLLPILFWGITILIVNDVLLGNPLASLSSVNSGINDWPVYLTNEQRIRYILFYPFVITYNGIFDAMGFITPLFLVFLPFYLIKEARKIHTITRELIFICLSAFVTLFIWITAFKSVFIFEVRYVLFLWILLYLPLAQLMDNVMQRSLFAQVGIQVILAALLLFMTVRIFYISLATYSPIDQRGVPHCNDLPMCIFFNPVNQLANSGDRVLVLSAFRYYLRPDLLACSSEREDYTALDKAAGQSTDKFWEEVQRQGFRYVIFDSFFNIYVLRFQNLPDLSSSLPHDVITLYDHTFKDYDQRIITESIYQIEESPSTIPEKTCVNENGIWQVQNR